MKPGYTTSEFWTTVLTHVVAVVALVHPGFATTGQWAGPFAVVIAGVASFVYARARTALKQTTATANAPAPAPPPATGTTGPAATPVRIGA